MFLIFCISLRSVGLNIYFCDTFFKYKKMAKKGYREMTIYFYYMIHVRIFLVPVHCPRDSWKVHQTDRFYTTDASTAKPHAHPRLSKLLFWKFYPLMETFSGKNLSKKMLYPAVNKIFRLLHSYTRISNIFSEISYDCQSRQVFS